jgi:hypothetical protein
MAWAETRDDRGHEHAEGSHQAGLRPLPALPAAIASFGDASGDYRPVQRGFALFVESFAPLRAQSGFTHCYHPPKQCQNVGLPVRLFVWP